MVRPEDLARIALFEGLEPHTLALVAGIATPRRYPRGAGAGEAGRDALTTPGGAS